MDKRTTKPAISQRRANWGCGGLLFLMILGTVVYFAPRAVPQSQVRNLCEEAARKEQIAPATAIIDQFAQDGYKATFVLQVIFQGSKINIPSTCVVSGDAKNPKAEIIPGRP